MINHNEYAENVQLGAPSNDLNSYSKFEYFFYYYFSLFEMIYWFNSLPKALNPSEEFLLSSRQHVYMVCFFWNRYVIPLVNQKILCISIWIMPRTTYSTNNEIMILRFSRDWMTIETLDFDCLMNKILVNRWLTGRFNMFMIFFNCFFLLFLSIFCFFQSSIIIAPWNINYCSQNQSTFFFA